MNTHTFLFICSCLLLFACKPEAKKSQDNTLSTPKTEVLKFADLPSIPSTSMNQLFNEGTYIDYIFYDLPFSISQDDKPSIHSNLRLISKERLGGISADCKPIGREFFHIGGTIAYEADVYFQDGCYGYVFLKDKKPVYANKVSEAGMKFYNNIMKQASQIQNQVQTGG